MTLNIQNLGRIAQAKIDVKPLTLFIGKNDSGKTYCASSLWSFIKFIAGQDYESALKNLSPQKKLIENFVTEPSIGEIEIEFSHAHILAIQKELQQSWGKASGKLLAASIGYDGFGSSKLTYQTDTPPDATLRIVIGVTADNDVGQLVLLENDNNDIVEVPQGCELSYEIYTWEGRVRKFKFPARDLSTAADIVRYQIGRDIAGYCTFGKSWDNYRSTIYLPAARTGIMLAIDFFVSGAMERTAHYTTRTKQATTSSLPAPLSEFAANLTYPFFRSNVAKLLSPIVGGEYARTKKRGEYQYTPSGMDKALPLAATSSLVTELAGFALMLGLVDVSDSFVIFEEPEAHLHLEAQREIAKILVRLVNKGKRLLVTTHSDTFLQQINNLIALNGHPNAKELCEELEISPEETISKNDVSAYDFKCTDGSTVVEELPCTPHGFIAPSLNEVLIKLTNETLAIREGLEE